MWVLKHRKQNKFVAKSGRLHSYTNKLEYAEKFSTKENAIKNSCVESEIPIKIS